MDRLTTQQNDSQNAVHLPRAERASFEKITGFPNLYKAYKEAARAKHARASVLRHDLHAESILLKLQWELQSGHYRHGKYNRFTITDPKPREVNAAPFTDRIVHHAIVRQIEPLFDNSFIYDSYACRRGKGTHAAARRLQYFLRSALAKDEPLYILRADITKFFASIDHAVMKQLLLKRVKDEKTLTLLGTIIDSYRTLAGPGVLPLSRSYGLPIGNLTSQLFANIYLNELDQFVKHGLHERYYLRYMDDFVLLHHDKAHLQKVLAAIRQFCADRLFLELHPRKTNIHKFVASERFVGYNLSPHLRRLSKPTVLRFERRMRKLRSCGDTTRAEECLQQFKAYGAFAHADGLFRKWGV